MSNNSKPLLVIVDMQNIYLPGNPWECENMDLVIANITKLVESERYEVVATKFRNFDNDKAEGVWVDYNKKYEKFNNNKFYNELIPEIDDLVKKYNIPVIEKSTYSGLDSLALMQKISVANEVLVTGVVAECCCQFFGNYVMDLGKYCVWVPDAMGGESEENVKLATDLMDCHFPLHGMVSYTKDLEKYDMYYLRHCKRCKYLGKDLECHSGDKDCPV